MLVVLAIIGFAVSVAVPALGPIRERSITSRAASDIRKLLEEARNQAVSSRMPVHLDYAAGKRLVIRESDRSLAIAADVELDFLTGAGLGPGAGKNEPSFLFLPDGTGSGGAVTVHAGGAIRRLNVSWLTGAVDDGG